MPDTAMIVGRMPMQSRVPAKLKHENHLPRCSCVQTVHVQSCLYISDSIVCSPPSVALKTPLVYFVTVLLIPPHKPLSEVYATVTLFSTSAPAFQ